MGNIDIDIATLREFCQILISINIVSIRTAVLAQNHSGRKKLMSFHILGDVGLLHLWMALGQMGTETVILHINHHAGDQSKGK